jgi:hypothetical protein
MTWTPWTPLAEAQVMKTHWPRPNFLTTANRPPWLAWLWLATAALVLGTVVRDGLALQTQLQQQTQAAADRAARAQRVASTTPAAASARASAAVASASQNKDAALKARVVAEQLAHPWGRILFTLEAEAAPGMQWLLFDHSAGSPELRFEGLAPNSDMVLDMVNRLSTHRGWSEVVLSRLQAPALSTPALPASGSSKLAPPPQGPADATSPLWRFEIKARVDMRAVSAAADRSMDSR